MRGRLLQILLLAAIAIAVGWFAVDRSPEPLIAAITGLVALLSVRRRESDSRAGPSLAETRGRIAVLPLKNITETSGREYFADGLTEELISVLSRIRGLRVIAGSSTSQYRDACPPLSEIAATLRVNAVLEGSVRSAENELRVSVRLVDVATETTLWTADYDRALRDVFAVQHEIATSVAHALEVTVVASEKAQLLEAPTSDLEAYDLYLLGRHDLNKRSEEGVRRSIERFGTAIAKDPDFAAAHAGIADAYVLATLGYASIPRDVAMNEARAAADRAIRAQETLSDAHTSRGFVLMNFDLDWAGAREEFERAIELNPSDARAYQWFAQCLSYQGRPEEAVPLVRHALELDPLSPLIATEAGWPHFYLGRLDEAEAQFRRAVDLDPSFALPHFNQGMVLEARGDLRAALAKYEHAAALSSGAPMFIAFVARAMALLGRVDDARRSLRTVVEAVDAGAPLSVYVAHVYEGLGDTQEALKWLDRAVADRDLLMIGIGSTWLPFDSLKGRPEYESIVQQIPTGTLGRPLAS